MTKRYGWSALILVWAVGGAIVLLTHAAQSEEGSGLAAPGERHLRNIRQLTFGAENAEPYFSFDGKKLIFQSTRDGYPVDQIYMMNTDGSGVHRVSIGFFQIGGGAELVVSVEGPGLNRQNMAGLVTATEAGLEPKRAAETRSPTSSTKVSAK